MLRHIGALLLATNTLLRPVYVPTEHNPADAPSRGKRRRARRVKQSSATSRVSRFQRQMLRLAQGVAKLEKAGAL